MRASAIGLFIILLAAGTAAAAEFQADLTMSEGAVVKNGKIFVSGAKYRMEIPDPAGPDVVVLVDPTAGTMHVLLPRYKAYLAGKTDDRRLASNDPFQMIKMVAKRYEMKSGGLEEIGEYQCRKEIFHRGDNDILTVWRCEKLGFPLKLVFHQQEDYFFELTNIKAGAVAGEPFAIPEGYAEVDQKAIWEKVRADPEMKAKREAWEKTRPKKGEINKHLTERSEVRVLLGKLTKLTVSGRPGGRKHEGTWYVVPYRDGKPLLDESATTHDGPATVKIPLDPAPDMLIFGVKEGEAWINAKYTGFMPLRLAVRETSWRQRPGGKSWHPKARKTVITFTADSVEGAKGAYGWVNVTRGEGAERKTEKLEYRLKPGESKTFTFTHQDGVTGLDCNTQSGSVEIDVLEDYRPPAEQKPF